MKQVTVHGAHDSSNADLSRRLFHDRSGPSGILVLQRRVGRLVVVNRRIIPTFLVGLVNDGLQIQADVRVRLAQWDAYPRQCTPQCEGVDLKMIRFPAAANACQIRGAQAAWQPWRGQRHHTLTLTSAGVAHPSYPIGRVLRATSIRLRRRNALSAAEVQVT